MGVNLPIQGGNVRILSVKVSKGGEVRISGERMMIPGGRVMISMER
jgi:hypothetical protein